MKRKKKVVLAMNDIGYWYRTSVLEVRPPVCLSTCQSVCLSVSLTLSLSVFLHLCLSLYNLCIVYTESVWLLTKLVKVYLMNGRCWLLQCNAVNIMKAVSLQLLLAIFFILSRVFRGKFFQIPWLTMANFPCRAINFLQSPEPDQICAICRQ